MSNQKIDAIGLFKNELQEEQQSVKVNAIRRLSIVLNSPNLPSNAKTSLLEFLNTFVETSDNDEVLFGLAESLGECAGQFGADTLMLDLLKKLLSADETVVRDKSVEAFISLITAIKKTEIKGKIVPFVVSLSKSDKFSQKMSALNAMAEMYPLVQNEERKILLGRINAMFSEESLILRRKLASRIGTLVKFIPKDVLVQDFFNHFKQLTLDDSDSVRILCIESLVDLCGVFNDEENKMHVIPIIIQLTGDKSWRVKNHLAKNFAGLSKSLGQEISMTSLVSIFSTLLKDQENEVRISAVKSLKEFVAILAPEKVNGILAYLQELSKDSVSLVRSGVCEVLLKMFGYNFTNIEKTTMKTRIEPIIINLINDQDLEVKIEGLKLLKPLSDHIGNNIIDFITSKQLQVDLTSKNWRVRFAELEALLDIARSFKNAKLFEKFFKKVFFTGLKDTAFRVRQLSVRFIKDMKSFLEQDYMKINILEEVKEMALDNKLYYTFRISAIYALESFYMILESAEARREKILQSVTSLCENKIENIRMVALRVLIKIYESKIDKKDREAILGYVKEHMLNDAGKEVQIIAARFVKGA